jgi:hypothetical protein
MTDTARTIAPRRLEKLIRQVQQAGVAAVPSWAANWLYWNAGLARIPGLPKLRTAYKYNRRTKKFGIQDPIIVYQMGKVGSSSLYRSLLAMDLDVPVYKIHFLNDLDKHEQWMRQAMPENSDGFRMFDLGRQLRREMEHAPHQKWNLVSMVRTPVPRGISGFFQNLEATFPSFQQVGGYDKTTAPQLVEYFVTTYFDRVPNEWYDQQVKDLFGIDVYATEFPKARGYQIYCNDNVRLLVIRLEDLNRCITDAMREFLGIPNFQLKNENVGEQKKYADLYREFLNALRLSPERLALWHDGKYATHFYTPEELADSVKRWV